MNGWPECVRCHGKHLIAHPTEALMANVSGTLCFDCHQKYARGNPTCAKLPDHFRKSIDALVTGLEPLDGEASALAERGLDVEPLREARTALQDAITAARTKIHSFDRSTFDQATTAGDKAALQTAQIIDGLNEEYRFRRSGLLVAIGIMALLALLLYLKLRRIERSG